MRGGNPRAHHAVSSPAPRLGDEAEALACHTEAHAADRTNLDTLSWLGAHYVGEGEGVQVGEPWQRGVATCWTMQVCTLDGC